MGARHTIKVWGISLGILFGLGAMLVHAQVPKVIPQTTKTIKAPLKEVQQGAKTAVEPIRDARNTTKAVTNAPREVVREVKATENAIDNAGNEVKRAKTDVEKAVDKVDGDKSKTQDSTSKAKPTETNSSKGGTVIIDERSSRDAVRDGDGYGSLNSGSGSSGGSSAAAGASSSAQSSAGPQSASAAESTEISYDYRRVYLPPGKGKTTLKSASSKSSGAPVAKTGSADAASSSAASAPVVPAKVKPDYSSSPARDALESADFSMETLMDLFQYAEWEGPNREHTMRSIDYTLKQLKRDIDEIRYKDPERSVWNYEKQYREWRNAYVQQGGQ